MKSLMGYSVRKAAQVVAFFARCEGGAINVLKLSKLLYLADREYLSRFDRPILYDRFVSMDHGPVDSLTLDYINGAREDLEGWGSFVTARKGNLVALADHRLAIADLDELSKAELEVLEGVWARFGGMTQYELRDFTHEHCPEWEDPQGSSAIIPYERVLRILGRDAETAERILDEIETDRALFDAMA
jgi:uncharacterized phage-associated protein